MKLKIRCNCADKDPYIVQKYAADIQHLLSLNIQLNGWCGNTAIFAVAHHLGLVASAHPEGPEQALEEFIAAVRTGYAQGKLEIEASGE